MKKAIAFILMICTLALSMVSCDFACMFNKDNSFGKDATGGGAPEDGRARLAACNLNNAEFDIDNVTVKFMYGYDLTDSDFLPVFDICFLDADNEFLIKQVEEDFGSEKYHCNFVYNEERRLVKVEYNHSENITIPKEVFSKDSGIIVFAIYTYHASQTTDSPLRATTALTAISYEKTNGKVVLTEQNKKFEAVKVGN